MLIHHRHQVEHHPKSQDLFFNVIVSLWLVNDENMLDQFAVSDK